jgi:hypothetical protein
VTHIGGDEVDPVSDPVPVPVEPRVVRAALLRARLAIPGAVLDATHDATIERFFTEPAANLLCVQVINGVTVVSAEVPRPSGGPGPAAAETKTEAAKGLALQFFLRSRAALPDASDAAFGDGVQWGVLGGGGAESLRQLVAMVFVPMAATETTWLPTVQGEFAAGANAFLSSVNDAASARSGKTLLFLPVEAIGDTPSDGQTQRLEAVLIRWTRQIQALVGRRTASQGSPLASMAAEHTFWQHRADDLAGAGTQLAHPTVARVAAALELAKSPYLVQCVSFSLACFFNFLILNFLNTRQVSQVDGGDQRRHCRGASKHGVSGRAAQPLRCP